MTYLMRLNQIITPEKDEPSGLNTYSAKHLCLLMFLPKNAFISLRANSFLFTPESRRAKASKKDKLAKKT